MDDSIREAFDLDAKLIYLNSANLSIAPRILRTKIIEYHDRFEKNPTLGLRESWGRLWQAQCSLARFLGADSKDLFLRPNVTAVLNSFILGIPLEPNSEILVGELEYGAIVNICRLRSLKDGLTLRRFQLPVTLTGLKNLTEASLVDQIIGQIGPRTRLLLLSHVLGGTGLILPIKKLARLTREKGIVLVVDGAYAPGAIPIDFSEFDDVDFYGCSLYKWMMGPKGTGFGWVNSRHQKSLLPQSAGWTTFDNHGPFAHFGEGSAFQSAFMLSGCQDFAPYFAISDLIHFWENTGPTEIQKRIGRLAASVGAEIGRRLRWQPLTPAHKALQAPMVVFRLPDALHQKGPELGEHLLRTTGIQAHAVPLRDRWHLAFSPHIFNTDEELARAVDRLVEQFGTS